MLVSFAALAQFFEKHFLSATPNVVDSLKYPPKKGRQSFLLKFFPWDLGENIGFY